MNRVFIAIFWCVVLNIIIFVLEPSVVNLILLVTAMIANTFAWGKGERSPT